MAAGRSRPNSFRLMACGCRNLTPDLYENQVPGRLLKQVVEKDYGGKGPGAAPPPTSQIGFGFAKPAKTASLIPPNLGKEDSERGY